MMDVRNFEQECVSVQKLHDLLEHEQTCLINAEMDKLPGIVKQKSSLIQSLSQLSRQRYDCLQKNGFNANELGMNEWVSTKAPKSIQSAWLSTQQTLLKSRELNRLNGILIGKHSIRNQQRLQVLQGQPEPHAQVYGPNGQATAKIGVRNSTLS